MAVLQRPVNSRAMRRRLFNFVSGFSFLIFISILVLWLYLPHRNTRTFYTSSARYSITAWRSHFLVTVMGGTLRSNGTFRAPAGTHWDGTWANPRPLPLGFGFGKSPSSDPTAAPYLGLLIPWWALLGLTATLPGLWLLLYLREHRSLHDGTNRCSKCGYDLRASPDRCPECGTLIAGKSS